MSKDALGPDELHVGSGSADSLWPPSVWGNPFRVSKVVSAAQAVELYGEWLISQKDLLSQLPSLDGRRLLCHCNKNSPCHVDSIIATWRSHRIPLFPRVRSMWQVCIDNLDVLEVCDWSDAEELSDSGHHEGMVIAGERKKHFHVPRSPGKEVVRVLHSKALGDQVDGFQGVIGPPAIFVRELIHFTLVTLSLLRVGRKWMQIPAGRWVRVFQFRRVGMSCFNEVWKFLYSCHGSQVLPSVVRQEVWSAPVLLSLFRGDLRVPVDRSVMASDASLSGGAICSQSA